MRIIFSFVCFFSQVCFSAGGGGDWKFGIGLGTSLNYLVALSGTGVSAGTPYFTTQTFQHEAATSIALDFRSLNRNSWGMIGGLEYETARALTKFTANGLNGTVTSANAFKFQTHFIHFGTAYRWDIFYIPLGLAYGLTKFTPATGATYTGTAENGMGAYIGMGWYVNDNFVIEYVSRSATTTLKLVAGADNETTTGTIGSALLGVKYFF